MPKKIVCSKRASFTTIKIGSALFPFASFSEKGRNPLVGASAKGSLALLPLANGLLQEAQEL